MSEDEMEEETYSLIFRSLKHPIRRRILRILVNARLSFSEILGIISIDSGHLSYHIENLGELVKHHDGKYELSGIGGAAVSLMSGVEEQPKLLTFGRPQRRRIQKIILVTVLAVIILLAALSIYYYSSLQAFSKASSNTSREMAIYFHLSVSRATDVTYLLRTYGGRLEETIPHEDNIEALIDGFFHELEAGYFGGLRGLMALHPELSEYKQPLYRIEEFVIYTLWHWESLQGGPTVRSILSELLQEAVSSRDYFTLLAAFEELNQTSFDKMRYVSSEVAESFSPFNATRLENTGNILDELQRSLDEWMSKYK